MIRTAACAAALLLLVCETAAKPRQQLSLSQSLVTSNGTRAVYTIVDGVPHWRLLPHLWVDKAVRLLWNQGKDIGVYVAPDVRQLELNVNNKERVWCGWEHFLGGPDNECTARIPPFGRTLVAVADHKDRSHFSAGSSCEASVEAHFSYLMLGLTLLGAALYWWAGPLSHSMPFRLSAGSLGFMALSVLILIFVLSRAIPNKRGITAVTMAVGSTFGAFVRYLFGRWLPTFDQLMHSKVALAYLGLSGLVGLAVTYYYDDEGNDKLKNILKYGMKLVGLALVATSTSKAEASMALACAIVALDVGINALHLGALPQGSSLGGSVLAAGKDASKMADAALHSIGQRLSLSPRSQPTHTRAALEPSAQPAQSRQARQAAQPEQLLGSGMARSPDLNAAAGVPLPGDDASNQSAGIGTPKEAEMRNGSQGRDSPLVQRGLIFNERTGKTIKIGAATYNKLVLEGYTPDRAAGVLTPPVSSHGKRRSSGPASSPNAPRSRSIQY